MTRCPSDYYKKVSAVKTDPSSKDIVCLLCECLGEEDKAVTNTDETQIAENHLMCECPKRPQ